MAFVVKYCLIYRFNVLLLGGRIFLIKMFDNGVRIWMQRGCGMCSDLVHLTEFSYSRPLSVIAANAGIKSDTQWKSSSVTDSALADDIR